ncbi:MAG: hypothetical protein ABI889_08770 [Gemmatimonadota bacterium]
MRHTRLIGGTAAVLLTVACSDSTGTSGNVSKWSGAVIKVAAENPNAKGELRGIVVALDSSAGTDSSKGTPVPGSTVVLNLKVTVRPATGTDTAWTSVKKIGEVVTDANGRFLVTAIPEGDYYLEATPPVNEPFYGSATWAFVSSGSNGSDAVIALPRRDPSAGGEDPPPINHPIDPPIDSM